MSLFRQKHFSKDLTSGEVTPMNSCSSVTTISSTIVKGAQDKMFLFEILCADQVMFWGLVYDVLGIDPIKC